MSAEVKRIEGTIDTVKGLTDQVIFYTGEEIDRINEALDYDIRTLQLVIKLRVARVEAILIPAIADMGHNASYHLLRAYFHASPSFVSVISIIWEAIKSIYEVIKYVLQVIEIIKTLELDDLLANYWGWFGEARDHFRAWVSQLSQKIGWGADGFLHLLHAAQGLTQVTGSITGKSYKWVEAQWMVQTGDVLKWTSLKAKEIERNPGDFMEFVFQWESHIGGSEIADWGSGVINGIKEALGKGSEALEGLLGVANELSAIQEGMPDIIRANIPAGIWDGIEKFEDIVEDELLPRIYIAERHLQQVNALFQAQQNAILELVNRLAHPGTNLLGIDDLPGYARDTEEWAIDNAASRKFGQSTDNERDEMEGDLAAFDIIDQAATSPLPALPFMSIEGPSRGALHGIVAEPKETWFIGGYSDNL